MLNNRTYKQVAPVQVKAEEDVIHKDFIVGCDSSILVTGANGFIGSKVVETLVGFGFRNVRCMTRSSNLSAALQKIVAASENGGISVINGNLLSADDCEKATDGASVIYHLAASTTSKSIQDAYMHSVDTTKNLLDAIVKNANVKRIVNVSSFTVYSNANLNPGASLDETCEMEQSPELRGEAYCYAKVKQEEILRKYEKQYKIPCVIVRPGSVYGPGNKSITARVGIQRHGLMLNFGGSNRIPFTYVDNCADAIVRAGLKKGIDGEVFNVVDDSVPTSSEFLEMYKKNVKGLRSIYVPKALSYLLCHLWEQCSHVSGGKLRPVFNRNRWSADWKGNSYSNEKLKRLVGWVPKVSIGEGMKRYFEYCRMETVK